MWVKGWAAWCCMPRSIFGAVAGCAGTLQPPTGCGSLGRPHSRNFLELCDHRSSATAIAPTDHPPRQVRQNASISLTRRAPTCGMSAHCFGAGVCATAGAAAQRWITNRLGLCAANSGTAEQPAVALAEHDDHGAADIAAAGSRRPAAFGALAAADTRPAECGATNMARRSLAAAPQAGLAKPPCERVSMRCAMRMMAGRAATRHQHALVTLCGKSSSWIAVAGLQPSILS